MNLRLRLLSTVAAAAMVTGFVTISSRAADVIAEPAAHDWSGLYIGAHVGYGEAYMKGCSVCDSAQELNAGDLDLNDVVFGGHLGYNVQMESLVLGVEADFTWLGFDDDANEAAGNTDSITGDVDYLASIRARAGFAMDDVLIYATGGIAFTEAEIETHREGVTDQVKFDDIGGVVGGGVEFAVSEAMSLRAEGLYYFFGDKEDANDPEAVPGEEFEFNDAFVVRVGASFHLGGL